jgi:multidrug efflux pump subunit AcrA (membrane-fusion protein)
VRGDFRGAIKEFRVAITTCFLIAILILSLATIISCGGRAKAPPPPKEINAAKIYKGTLERTVLFTGNIEAQDFVNVFSRANGKVVKKLLKEGDPVKKGQGILAIERDEIGYTFKPLILDSPIDGYVGSILVDVGTYVYDRTVFSQNPAVVVVRPGKMRVKLDIPERYLDTIHLGTKVQMKVDYMDGKVFDGTIITAAPVVDEKTRTARIEVEVPNQNGELRHGMFGRMHLVVEKRENTLIAPLQGISWEGEKQFVYKVKDGKVERLQVKTGLRNDVHVEILEGLAENDHIAVGDLLDLRDGELVAVKE